MPTQDLTPRLRTRLSRLERVVGLFVAVAALLLIAGLAFYIYRVADRRGWFVRKLPYFTFVANADGLRVGEPVRMMGFDVGEITEITAQPPFDPYNVYVAFVVRAPYEGYLWDDSRAVVASLDFLGKRTIEVSKGTNGPPSYLFNPVQTVSIDEVERLADDTNYFLAQSVFDEVNSTNQLGKPFDPLTNAPAFRNGGIGEVVVMNRSIQTKWPTSIWEYKEGRYTPFDRKKDKGFFLPPDEAPALTARLEQVADTIETALPNILGLTNQLYRVLNQAGDAASNANFTMTSVKPLLANLTQISVNLTNRQGALGEWLLPPPLNLQLTQTLASANSMLTNSDQQVAGLSSNLTAVILNLASITSNLNAQVAGNSNILSNISQAITNADHLMQGLKRHWLLRSAFKNDDEKKPEKPRERRPTPATPPRRYPLR